LQSTAKWTQSSRKNISTSHKDFKIREEYCRRFMMLFMPFRSMDNFLENTDNYHSAFATYDANNMFPDNVKEYANNIQDIRNSLRVNMPMNILQESTLDDEGDEVTQETNCEADGSDEALMQNIAELFASNNQNEETLFQPCNDITPSYVGTSGATPQPVFEKEDHIFKPNQNVCQIQEDSIAMEQTAENNLCESRFVTNVIALNSLAYHCLIRDHQGPNANKTQNATGTVESVLQWGTNDNLDTNQKKAFEILAATYILTFHDDLIGEEEALNENAGLNQLTQKKKTVARNYACS
jgi:hypothetical protein